MLSSADISSDCSRSPKVVGSFFRLQRRRSGIATRFGIEAPVLEEFKEGVNLTSVGEVNLGDAEELGSDPPWKFELVLGLGELNLLDEDLEEVVTLHFNNEDNGLDELDEKNVGVDEDDVKNVGVLSVGELCERERAASCHCCTGTGLSEGDVNRKSNAGIILKRGDRI